MISTFSLLSGKPKKAICGVFCGRSIFNPLRFSPNKELVKNFIFGEIYLLDWCIKNQ